MRPLSAPALGILVLASLPGIASARMMSFTAQLSGASEVPPVTTNGKGAATATLNTTTRRLSWTVRYSDLSGPAKAGHIHGPAASGQNAPVMVPFTGNLKSPIRGSATLTPTQMSAVEAGKTYVNIHTAQHPAGEIRGQLEPKQ
ncbi:MAG TPA: CHRD domain-containing protein [Stellaceae bacterium]|nr:CHRD domain-containing protein [Stellaceae bacterium]